MWDLLLGIALLHVSAPDPSLAGAAAAGHIPLPAAIQHWELERTLASELGGQPLVLERADPTFEEVDFGDGKGAALRVPPGARVRVPTALVPHGPGFVDGFTVILDVRFEDGRWQRAPVVQTDADDDDDAEADVVVRQRGKLAVFGVAGERGGKIVPGQWHRLAMVVDPVAGSVTHYVDGQRAASERRAIKDSRWSLEPELLLFSDDEDGARPQVWLAAVQVHASPLPARAIEALGGASASGIAPQAPGDLSFSASEASDGGQATARGSLQTLRWSARSSAGDIELALVGAGGQRVRLGAVPIGSGEASFRVPPTLAAGAWQVHAQGKGVEASGPRLVIDEAPADTSGLGRDLVTNGGFAAGLEGWALDGEASVTNQRLVGTRGDYTLRQTIDLARAGIGPELADQGLVVEASVMAWRRERSGRYDDRGELAVRCLDAEGAELGRIRTLHVESQEPTRHALRGALPRGTRALELTFVALQRRAPKNELGVDDLQLRLVADATPAMWRLSKQPILHPADDPHVLTVLFETDRADATPVVVWSSEGGGERRASPALSTTVSPRHQIHEVRMGPLEPGVDYSYRVEVGPWTSQTWTAKGPVLDGRIKVAWLADNQHGWQTFRKLLPAVAAAGADFAVLAGDIVQHGYMLREWQTEWFSTLSVADFGQTTPIWFARGNHDGEFALSYAYTSMPGNQSWFAVTRAGARIIVLNTEAEHVVIPEQLAWLRAELASPASREADFRIVTFHKAPFSNRWSHKTSTYDGEDWVRAQWVPVFSELGVDLVVAGHAHAYQRMDLDGVRYVVVGGAGGWLDKYKTARWPMVKDLVVHHWALMELGEGRLDWRATDEAGKVIDSFTMRAARRGR